MKRSLPAVAALLKAFITAALAALLLNAAHAQTALKVGYTMAPQFGAAYIAKDKGYFDKRGLDVTMQFVALTSTVPATLMSDTVQIGGVAPTVFLQAVESGLDLVAIAAGSLHEWRLNEVQVVAGTRSGIRTPAELAGRKLGLPGLNGSLHVMTTSWLKKNGVDPAKVTLVEVPFPQMLTVLQGGNVDAVVTVEPFLGGMVKDGIGAVVPGLHQGIGEGSATTVYVATRKWVQANGPAVAAFRAALADAVELARRDPTAARGAIGQYVKMPPAALQTIPFPSIQSNISEAALQTWVDAMLDQGMLKRKPNVAALIAR